MSNSPVLPRSWRLESLSQFSRGDVGSRIPESVGPEDSRAGDPGSWVLAPGPWASSTPLVRGPGSCPHFLPFLAPALGAGGRWGERKGREGPGAWRGGTRGCGKAGEGTRSGDSVGGWRPTVTAARDPRAAPTPPEQAPPWPDPADSPRPCSRGLCGCFGTRVPPGESC